ncbi:uncharacterized protein G2W53_009909 [Senna tora]|uniref:Uncharacterized protein n=1 Tax=Senna tora TaxID=362788 RepID=A0A835CAN1_9FABA|nr:uncharacterized protein G2W53_009909 [Senna tora]
MAWEERGSYLNILWTTNHGQFSETITNYEANHLLRNKSVRIVFANRSGFEAPIGVFMAWEERRSYLNIFWTKNRGRISETITNYEANHLLRKNLHELRCKTLVAQVSETRWFALYLRTRVDLMLQLELSWDRGERGSCLNIFRMTNRDRISETYMNYEAKHLLRNGVDLMLQLESSWHGWSVDHVLTYSGREIEDGSQKPSRITRENTCCASE